LGTSEELPIRLLKTVKIRGQEYNPQKLIVYDPAKIQAAIAYHQKEGDRLKRLM